MMMTTSMSIIIMLLPSEFVFGPENVQGIAPSESGACLTLTRPPKGLLRLASLWPLIPAYPVSQWPMQALNVCLAPLGKGDCDQAKKMDRARVEVAGVRRTGGACWPDDAKTNPARKLLWPRVKWLQTIVKTRSAKSMIIGIVIDACAGSMSRKRRAECKRAVHYTQCSGP